MGTINYGTSEFITLGIKPYEVDDYLKSDDFMEFVREWYPEFLEDDSALENLAYDQMSFDYDADRENAESIINSFGFDFFKVSIEPGYYEGLYINIEYDDGAIETWEDKRTAQKEVTQLKKMLVELAGCGYVAVWPGWVTSYFDYNETVKQINAAVKEMRAKVRTTQTNMQYWREWRAKHAS